MLGGVDAQVSCLDPQGGVVADHGGRTEVGLSDRRTDDAVVGHARIESVLDQQVLADVVDLDLERRGAVAGRHGLGERATVGDAQLLEGTQRRAGRSADVVGPALEPVEFLDHRERHDHVGVLELQDAGGVRDQHRRVDHQPSSLRSIGRVRLGPVGGPAGRAGRCVSGRKQVGHHVSSTDRLSYPTEPVCSAAVARRGGCRRTSIPARARRRCHCKCNDIDA